MKNSFRARLLAALVLGLGISLAMAPGVSAVQDVVVSSEIYVYIADPGETLALAAATVDQIEVTASTVIITMSAGGNAVTISSPGRYRFTVTGITDPGTTCGSGSSTLVIPSQSVATAVTVDPSTTCPSGGSGGGGTPAASPSPSASPTPSGSPTPSPTESPAASPTPSPSASPTPTPLALVPIPEVPANPTTAQIQAAITAIINNIAYLQAELLKIQQPATGAFTYDLYYGLWNNAEVKRLQEFLISKGYLASGLNTGNYYLKTVEAVKAYQTAKGITPVIGRCGPLTRAAINADLGF